MGVPVINPLHWGYRGSVKHHVSETGTVHLRLKASGSKTITLDHFVTEHVPGLRHNARFQLNSYLFTGVLQTIYLNSKKFGKTLQFFYGRELVKFSDGGTAAVDWAMPSWEKKYTNEDTGEIDKRRFKEDASKTLPQSWPILHPLTRYLTDEEISEVRNDSRPLVIIQHGLGGGSHESVIKSLAKDLTELSNSKFNVAVLTNRGCGRSKISTKSLFSALSTNDLREFINRERKRKPKRKIYCVGVSFGAVIVGNYLAEEGSKCPLAGALCLSGPWDMSAAASKIAHDFWSQRIFGRALAGYMYNIVKVNMAELEYKEGVHKVKHPASKEHPSHHVYTKENLRRAENFSTTLDFDNLFTAPSMGFRNAHEYYRAASPIRRLKNIRVPTLIINAFDDPIIGPDVIPYKQAMANENLLLCTTDLGGHMAYLDRDGNSWVTKQIAQYFKKFNELIA